MLQLTVVLCQWACRNQPCSTWLRSSQRQEETTYQLSSHLSNQSNSYASSLVLWYWTFAMKDCNVAIYVHDSNWRTNWKAFFEYAYHKFQQFTEPHVAFDRQSCMVRYTMQAERLNSSPLKSWRRQHFLWSFHLSVICLLLHPPPLATNQDFTEQDTSTSIRLDSQQNHCQIWKHISLINEWPAVTLYCFRSERRIHHLHNVLRY